MDGHFFVHSDSGSELTDKLNAIREEAESSYLLLAHLSGTVIADAGSLPAGDATMFAALSAASFSSMASLAVLIQEHEFYQMIHLGKKSSLLLYPVNRSSILVFVVKNGGAFRQIRERLPFWKRDVDILLQGMGGTVRIPH
jgi:predicted regulator of Ras-like GTPase activity (Roadblock/LC7/MglB family)